MHKIFEMAITSETVDVRNLIFLLCICHGLLFYRFR